MGSQDVLAVGLNPYGLTYTLGLQAAGTARANPAATGLQGFLRLAEQAGARVLEIPEAWLDALDETSFEALLARLRAARIEPVLSSNLQRIEPWRAVALAGRLGARLIRVALTGVLCGDRSALGPAWHDLVASVRQRLAACAAAAAPAGLTFVIENHQDFTSAELAGFCDEFGDAVRIVLDTGNSFPVGEAPLEFARTAAPHVRYLHLKDYRVQWTDEGLRLVRCAIGDGAVPFAALVDLLGEHHAYLPAAIEPGALEARHVRLFTEAWWHLYPARDARSLAACLLAARRNRLPDGDEYRTPWELGEDHRLVEYERATIARSIDNMSGLGLWERPS